MAESTSLPRFFRLGCCRFFQWPEGDGDDHTEEDSVDAYWLVSRRTVYAALYRALETDRSSWLPRLQVPANVTFWHYAEQCWHERCPEPPDNVNPGTNVARAPTPSPRKPYPHLGLAGRMGSGKSTVAHYLQGHYGYTEYALAQPLKAGVQCWFSLSDAQLHDPHLKNQVDPRWGVTPRYLLQHVGTELFRHRLTQYLPLMRQLSYTLWIENFRRWYQHLHDQHSVPPPVVVSDVRFPDEIEALRTLGLRILWIERDLESIETHSSEQSITALDADHTLLNTSDRSALERQVDAELVALPSGEYLYRRQANEVPGGHCLY